MFSEEEMEIGEDERYDHRKDDALAAAGYCPHCGEHEEFCDCTTCLECGENAMIEGICDLCGFEEEDEDA